MQTIFIRRELTEILRSRKLTMADFATLHPSVRKYLSGRKVKERELWSVGRHLRDWVKTL